MSVERILSWFPRAWRARYEAEVRDLLESHPIGIRERVDLVRACADAWLREGASWGLAVARGLLFVGSRVVVLVAIGWLGTWGADAVAEGFGWSARSSWSLMSDVAGFLRIVGMAYVGLFVVRPFMEDPAQRPSRLEGVVYPLVFALLVALDQRPSHLGDILLFGIIATARYSWFHIGTGRPSLSVPRSVLGLR
ncbi:MAG: hypothetical protein NUW22_10395 [Acidobacteria bacterium]|nr:hypothetical protein [Acidobacteriota bacterium]